MKANISTQCIEQYTAQYAFQRIEMYTTVGVALAYYRDPVSDHISLAASGAPLVIRYLSSRFAGMPAPRTC
jgi:hypothetical protein